MSHVCDDWKTRNKGICVFNGGILGVCLCRKHYLRRDEDWTDEEKKTMDKKWRQFMPELFDEKVAAS